MKVQDTAQRIKLSSAQRQVLATALTAAMFTLIWESGYSPKSAPDEDAIHETLAATLNRLAGAA